jgi:hypothetical protein
MQHPGNPGRPLLWLADLQRSLVLDGLVGDGSPFLASITIILLNTLTW